jgi:TolB protein
MTFSIRLHELKMKLLAIFLLLFLVLSSAAFAQNDWIRTGTGLGVEKVRLAVPDFKPQGSDPKTNDLLKTFNDTLWNDLDNAGIFDLVSKSFYPLAQPGTPPEIKLDAWSNAPANAGMVAFGNFGVSGADVFMQGWLDDVKNTASPQVLGKQYRETATADNARLIAHRFADEIIFRLGGGIQGVAESKIFFISSRSGHKEVWEMDYDGAGQRQLTHMNSISISPRVSPDGSRVVFSSFIRHGLELVMYSLDLGRMVSFPSYSGTNISPAWSSDGAQLAFSSSMTGDSEIYTADSSGTHLKRLTVSKGPDVSPAWNPKTGAQIAFVSARIGNLPQIFIMDSDGTNVQRLTDGGYAVSPSWSPNGELLAFAWRRNYGPGEPGAQDIYIMDIATRQWVQLTHESGVCDFPTWSPDGRHIDYECKQHGKSDIWSMLADGSKPHSLTASGDNSQPNWSFK